MLPNAVFTITERILTRWLVESYGLWEYRPRKWRNMSRSAGCFVLWFFVKVILFLDMAVGRNFWVSELVLEAAKVEQKHEKQQEKGRFAQLEEYDLQQLAKNKCYCKKETK